MHELSENDNNAMSALFTSQTRTLLIVDDLCFLSIYGLGIDFSSNWKFSGIDALNHPEKTLKLSRKYIYKMAE